MKIPAKILLGILLLTSTNSLEARGNHSHYGKASLEAQGALAKEAIQNQIYFSKHHKKDSLKDSRKRSHGSKYMHKHTHNRKR
jgi:hypothetical protein